MGMLIRLHPPRYPNNTGINWYFTGLRSVCLFFFLPLCSEDRNSVRSVPLGRIYECVLGSRSHVFCGDRAPSEFLPATGERR